LLAVMPEQQNSLLSSAAAALVKGSHLGLQRQVFV
jgi:hypothetical protein